MCSSVDLPAPDGATSATDCPGHSASSAPLRMSSVVVALPILALDLVQVEDRDFASCDCGFAWPSAVTSPHSYRSASTGSSRAARQDG